MDRRDFLQATAAGASGMLLLGGSSCASVPKIPLGLLRRKAPPDMGSYLTRVDAGMAAIGQWSPMRDFPDYAGDREAADALARKSLRTLYMTAMFADLPEDAQRHPGMQERIWNAMPEMDEAAAGMEEFLATRSPEDLRDVQLALRSSLNPGMQIFAGLDEHAGDCGVSLRRRLQTRVIMTEANWRLRNQPPSLVIQEILGKVQKAAATDLSRQVHEDEIAARIAEQIFWQEQAGVGTPAAPENAAHEPSKRQKRLNRGAALMGIGVVVGGIALAGATSSSEGIGFAFVATVGAVLFLIGLITLLVGVATSSSPPADRQ